MQPERPAGRRSEREDPLSKGSEHEVPKREKDEQVPPRGNNESGPDTTKHGSLSREQTPETLSSSEEHPESTIKESVLSDSVLNVFRASLQQLVGGNIYENWCKQLAIVLVDDELIIRSENHFHIRWLKQSYRKEFQSAAASIHPGLRIRFEVSIATEVKREEPPHGVVPSADPMPQHGIRVPLALPVPRRLCSGPDNPPRQSGRGQNNPSPRSSEPRATNEGGEKSGRRFADLSDLVVGECNQMAYSACQNVARLFQDASMLYLYGPVGTGKTHFLEGTYRQLRKQMPQGQILYLTAEAFTNYFTTSMRDRSLPGLRLKFRSADALLVDDVDFFDGKKVVSEEFLNTVRELQSRGCPVAVTSDRHPNMLTETAPELKTRYLAGIYCRIDPPDPRTRLEIVRRKGEAKRDAIVPDVYEYIASRFTESVRELEGAVHSLHAWHTVEGKKVTLSVARQVLGDLERDCLRRIRLSDVERTVAGFFGIEAADLRSRCRSRLLSQPRMVAMYLARKHTQTPYSEIGKYFGGRHHSTVISSEEKITKMLANRESIVHGSRVYPFAELLNQLEQRLLAG